MWVLDTNTLIYFFKGQGCVAESLFQKAPRDIGVPTVALYELQVGIAKSASPERRQAQLAELSAVVQVLPFQADEAQTAATIRAELERQGHSIVPYDILIAATARAHGATLVTRKTKEFGRIDTLKIEDWYGDGR